MNQDNDSLEGAGDLMPASITIHFAQQPQPVQAQPAADCEECPPPTHAPSERECEAVSAECHDPPDETQRITPAVRAALEQASDAIQDVLHGGGPVRTPMEPPRVTRRVSFFDLEGFARPSRRRR